MKECEDTHSKFPQQPVTANELAKPEITLCSPEVLKAALKIQLMADITFVT